ncbi:hypothetical protein HHUSO_G1001 [Huso huso]|uniref:Chromodomain-helicase-DNA-binding protein 1-like C-terminal domain-containing protein n=1 Tax=Huso huso TaxID=61971 RepID=A0ABR1ABH9_HUSHU
MLFFQEQELSDNSKQASAGDSVPKEAFEEDDQEKQAVALKNKPKKSVYDLCRKYMKPVKAELKLLDEQDFSSKEEELDSFHKHILKIGAHLNMHVQRYSSPKEANEWNVYLWQYVSIFSNFDDLKLCLLYNFAAKKDSEKFKATYEQSPQSFILVPLCKSSHDLEWLDKVWGLRGHPFNSASTGTGKAEKRPRSPGQETSKPACSSEQSRYSQENNLSNYCY